MMYNRRIFTLFSLVIILISIGLVIMTFWGYGNLELQVPPHMSITVNGHSTAATHLKLRPGTYTIRATSAQYFTTYTTVKVNPFLRTIYEPPLNQRTADSIVGSALGAAGTFGIPPTNDLQWFSDHTWTVENIGPSTPDVVATHFVNGTWTLAYRTGDTINPSIPTAVAQEIINREARINAGTL